jgi:hypothetical protein
MEIKPSISELSLYFIVRHTSVWMLLVEMVLVLNLKALIHRDQVGAVPIHRTLKGKENPSTNGKFVRSGLQLCKT